LVALYEIHLYEPALYSAIHNFCMAASGLATIALIGSGIQAYFGGTSLLVRRRLGIVLVGTVAGFALPAWLLTVSALSGGDQAINLAAFTAPLFPLSLAYAVVKLDLFEIDAMLRRAINYLLLTGMVAGAYGVLVLGLGFVLQTASLASSPAFPLIFSLLMLVLFNPLRERLQHAVDRLYDRTSHNAQKTLERASGALAATLNLEDIYELTIDTIRRALLLDTASLWLAGGSGDFVAIVTSDGGVRAPLECGHPLLARLRRGSRAVSIYDFADGEAEDASTRACRSTLALLGADLVLPLRVRGDLIGMLALGKKRSGRLFTLDDLDFLSTFVNQAVVAILNARSYRKVEELNVGLEQKVAQRTGELAATNQELERSLAELGRAYDDLQRSQENLVRAEKMAALGRLTAGIAHEINTPLGAALNSLKVLAELADEYAGSIGDPTVDERDHRELAGELRELVRNVTAWTGKAAGYIRSIKAHTRTMGGGEERSFDLAQLIEDTRRLLAHRLRISSCTLAVDCPPGVTVYGDPGKLGQVLTNLITNAVDAYEDQGAAEGMIQIGVRTTPEGVEIAVEDRGCGVAAENLERIFEELFTTKPPGKGTGLGLPISRDIVSDCFGGRILVASAPGRGSRFTVALPHREPGSIAAADARERGVVVRDHAPL
jgi:signal transduction histidine kinase